MTDPTLDLDAIEARANAALPAPWEAGAGWVYYCGKYERPTDKLQNVCDDKPTLDFIAHCRTDVPALCAEVRRLQARLALVPPKLCGRCEATLHPERRERTLCRRCQTDAIREGVRRYYRKRAALAAEPPAEATP